MSSLVDTDFKALWKGGMLSITGMIIMGFKWKKLRIRSSLGPGSVAEMGAGREVRGLRFSWEKDAEWAINHRASPPQPEDGPGSIRKRWSSSWASPTPQKKSAHAPIALDQRLSSRPTVPPEDIWSFQETFCLPQQGKGFITDTWWAEARDAVNHPECTGWPHSKESPSPDCQHCQAEEPRLSSREAEPKPQEKRDRPRRSISRKGVWSCIPHLPAPWPLLLTSRPRQVTRVDQTGDGREEPLSQITCSFAFWSKTHFSYYMSDRTGNPAFFFLFKAKQPRPHKNTIISLADLWTVQRLPDKSQLCLQMSNSPTKPNQMPGLLRQRIVNFIKYVKGEKNQLWKIVILSFNKNIIGSYEFGRSE